MRKSFRAIFSSTARITLKATGEVRACRPTGWSISSLRLQKLQKLQQQLRTIRRRRVDSYSASKDTMQSAIIGFAASLMCEPSIA